MVLMDNNRWYHWDRPAAFRLPQGAVPYSTFRSDIMQKNSTFEIHSLWQTPPTLSCSMP